MPSLPLSRRHLFAAVLAALAAASALLPSPASRAGQGDAAADPRSFIEQLGSQAVEALTSPALSQGEREVRFRKMLHQHFDLPAIGKFVLGRYWRAASEAEREEFLRLFEELIVQSYARRFAEYSGERFQVHSVRQDADDYAIVQSQVIRPGAESLRVDWRVRDRDGYKIVDIMVEGVSMVVTQRADFASVIQSSGGSVAGLIDLLRQKTGHASQQSALP